MWDFRLPLGAKPLNRLPWNLGCVTTSRTLPQIPNMGAIGLRGASRRMREISLWLCFFPFFFFVSSPRLQVATVDRFSRSIHQTTRFRARKCLLGSRWWIFTFTPLFSPKSENLHYGLWQLRMAITRPLLKIEERCLHQGGGFRGRAI